MEAVLSSCLDCAKYGACLRYILDRPLYFPEGAGWFDDHHPTSRSACYTPDALMIAARCAAESEAPK